MSSVSYNHLHYDSSIPHTTIKIPFEVLTAVEMPMCFGAVTSFGLARKYRRFDKTCFLHLHLHPVSMKMETACLFETFLSTDVTTRRQQSTFSPAWVPEISDSLVFCHYFICFIFRRHHHHFRSEEISFRFQLPVCLPSWKLSQWSFLFTAEYLTQYNFFYLKVTMC